LGTDSQIIYLLYVPKDCVLSLNEETKQ